MCAHTNNLQFDGLAIQLNGADLEVHSDGADIAFCVGVILQRGRTGQGQAYSTMRKAQKLPSGQRHLKADRTEKHVLESETELLTAKRSRRQDFPTPESPMSRSLNR